MWDFTVPFLLSLWLPHGISIYTDILKLTDRGLHFTNYWFTFGIRTISSKCHGNAEKKVSGSKVLCNFSKLWEKESFQDTLSILNWILNCLYIFNLNY